MTKELGTTVDFCVKMWITITQTIMSTKEKPNDSKTTMDKAHIKWNWKTKIAKKMSLHNNNGGTCKYLDTPKGYDHLQACKNLCALSVSTDQLWFLKSCKIMLKS